MRRRMFNGGMGMTKPGASMASGILASSQPLVDVLAGQARDNLTNGINVGNQMYGSNVQGTNLMNQGGVANYAPGGISYTTNEAGDVLRVPVSGSVEEAEIVNNEGLGMFAGMDSEQFNFSDQPGNRFSRMVDQKGAVELFDRRVEQGTQDPTKPMILPDGTVVIRNANGETEIAVKGRQSGDDIYEANVPQNLTAENTGLPLTKAEDLLTFERRDMPTEQYPSETETETKTDVVTEGELPGYSNPDMPSSGGKKEDVTDYGSLIPPTTSEGENKITGQGLGMFAGLTDEDLAKPTTTSTSTSTVEEQQQKINDILKTANEKQSTQTSDNLLKTKIKEFTDAMPEYEGMSDDEKSFAIIKMGMAIAAGQSPNVIENISKGVLATIDEFGDDPKAKRKYEQQLKLSAAQYALQAVNDDESQKRKDERTGVWMVNDKDQSIFITNEMIVNGTLPEGITSENLEIANITALGKKQALVSTALVNARKEMLIDDTYKDEQQEKYQSQVKRFNDAEVGKLYIENAILNLDENTGDIVSFRGGVQNMGNKVLRTLGFKNNKQWDTIDEMRKDVRLAFQKLIPVSLAGVQSANSISNRDVQFLADAYVDSAMLKDGSFSFVGINEDILRSRLQETIKLFKANQKDSLSQIATIENNLATRILPGQSLEDFADPKKNVSALEAIAAFKPNLLGTGTQGKDNVNITIGDITLTQSGVSDTGIPIWNPSVSGN